MRNTKVVTHDRLSILDPDPRIQLLAEGLCGVAWFWVLINMREDWDMVLGQRGYDPETNPHAFDKEKHPIDLAKYEYK